MMTSTQIRQSFINFFVQRHGHTFVPSSPVVPHDDPTLLFTNAGMNQFKPIFLGEEKRDYTRAVNTQKCVRAGGKHNDLEDVGRSRRHHTFFEMLGNWSFGDYFKQGAIEMAWELLTGVWQLDPSRLHVTCFIGDQSDGVPRDTEAADIWHKGIGLPLDHIHWGNKADGNFWEMGETGPCGPCTEIFYDRTPDKSGGPSVVGGDDPRVMEIWNNVFIQYNRNADRSLVKLPQQHVDTGMGFERITQVLQGKDDNYGTDIWTPIFAQIQQITGQRYGGRFPASDLGDRSAETPESTEAKPAELKRDIAFRVIADHARMATFAITDGAKPDNKGRDSVVRSVLRRAVRFGYQQFGLRSPFMHKLVGPICESMGDAFPELRKNAGRVTKIIEAEEASFLATIERGLGLFEEAAGRALAGENAVGGKDAFDLHTTYGFPIDLTTQMAFERGLGVDRAGYDSLFKQFQLQSGRDRKKHADVAIDLSGFAVTDDSPKYDTAQTTGRVLGWLIDDKPASAGELTQGQQASVLLDRTSFYAEQGGQVGDVGTITTPTGKFLVADTERRGRHVLHWGEVDAGTIAVGQTAQVHVDKRRADIMRNHTGTHLANWALRKVVGDHVEQKGSLVDAERLRFDFTHDRALSADEIEQVERLVNEQVNANVAVSAVEMPLRTAQTIAGVRAVFGEKYPDPVRVVSIGSDDPVTSGAVDFSVEFCGGTHLARTGDIGFFHIVEESSVSKGVRRITAVTGMIATRAAQESQRQLQAVCQQLGTTPAGAAARVAALQDELKQLKKKLASGAGSGFDLQAAARAAVEEIGAQGFAVVDAQSAGQEQLMGTLDSIKKQSPGYAVLLASSDGEKLAFVAACSDEAVKRGLKAGDWVRDVAKAAGGGGGGKPQLAQAGGKDVAKLPAALDVARAFAGKALG